MRPVFAMMSMLIAMVPGMAAADVALTSASPSADSVAEGAPAVVELSFSEAVRPNSSSIRVLSQKNARMDRGAVYTVNDPMHLAVAVKPLLPGRYRVEWRVETAGSRRSSGVYGFTVMP